MKKLVIILLTFLLVNWNVFGMENELKNLIFNTRSDIKKPVNITIGVLKIIPIGTNEINAVKILENSGFKVTKYKSKDFEINYLGVLVYQQELYWQKEAKISLSINSDVVKKISGRIIFKSI